MENHYHFITHWRVKGAVKEISDILGNAPDLVRWWPSVYLDVEQLEPGNENGLGRVVNLYTKGWLPYTLRWNFRVVEIGEKGYTLEARGDFIGRGIWTFEQDGEYVNVKYDWKISAEKPLLRSLTPLMRPLFSANHHWAMAMGEQSLNLELARRRAKTPEEFRTVPAPPPPTSPRPFIFGGLTALIGLTLLTLWAYRRN